MFFTFECIIRGLPAEWVYTLKLGDVVKSIIEFSSRTFLSFNYVRSYKIEMKNAKQIKNFSRCFSYDVKNRTSLSLQR